MALLSLIVPLVVFHFLFSQNSTGNIMPYEKSSKWFPLESNPQLLNQYIERLGFDTAHYQLIDIFSTEEWALNMIPRPVAAVILLYPLTDVQNEHAKTEETSSNIKGLWFIKQRISNACGTIGVLHALLNAPELLRQVCIRPNSWLASFSADCPGSLTPTEKAERLERDSTICTLHDEATSDESNQTDRGSLEDQLNTHFVALVHVNEGLYELDGRKEGAVRHGDTTQETLLGDACKVVEMFMKRDPNEMRFTIMALAPTTVNQN
jgi:ubiquitin carboxyl-terminal hydrolase L3